MGICKCRKSTGLFCFGHRKAVCYNCVPDHNECVVKTYVEWLKNGDFDEPTCALCHSSFRGDSFRLMCLHLFHKACLDAYCEKKYSEHTALAGFGCPVCSSAIVPPVAERSILAAEIRKALANTPWAVQAGFVESKGYGPAAEASMEQRVRVGGAHTMSASQRRPGRQPRETGGTSTHEGEEEKYHGRDLEYTCIHMGLLPKAAKGSGTPGDAPIATRSPTLWLRNLVI
eukprot:CAMPEP_0119123280 /NCGR_PEP_ID=MMETSP1310-20130426/3271_1 /TAXON_ID=464262 /ORGANISM="Genus nov. species nov., Strain RCC2339" /LENGTH=228 /DNA_ID=CAMNT_0007113065 /DNA_START=41 /DNA_END=724 /DNA_ORIENTATION=+